MSTTIAVPDEQPIQTQNKQQLTRTWGEIGPGIGLLYWFDSDSCDHL